MTVNDMGSQVNVSVDAQLRLLKSPRMEELEEPVEDSSYLCRPKENDSSDEHKSCVSPSSVRDRVQCSSPVEGLSGLDPEGPAGHFSCARDRPGKDSCTFTS